MSVPAWIAFASLLFAFAVQTVGFAFWLGGMSARMRHMENQKPDDCATQLAALDATLSGMKESMDRRLVDLEHTMRNLLTGRVPSPRRKPSDI